MTVMVMRWRKVCSGGGRMGVRADDKQREGEYDRFINGVRKGTRNIEYRSSGRKILCSLSLYSGVSFIQFVCDNIRALESRLLNKYQVHVVEVPQKRKSLAKKTSLLCSLSTR